jgi:hypothetical protein
LAPLPLLQYQEEKVTTENLFPTQHLRDIFLAVGNCEKLQKSLEDHVYPQCPMADRTILTSQVRTYEETTQRTGVSSLLSLLLAVNHRLRKYTYTVHYRTSP